MASLAVQGTYAFRIHCTGSPLVLSCEQSLRTVTYATSGRVRANATCHIFQPVPWHVKQEEVQLQHMMAVKSSMPQAYMTSQ